MCISQIKHSMCIRDSTFEVTRYILAMDTCATPTCCAMLAICGAIQDPCVQRPLYVIQSYCAAATWGSHSFLSTFQAMLSHVICTNSFILCRTGYHALVCELQPVTEPVSSHFAAAWLCQCCRNLLAIAMQGSSTMNTHRNPHC